MPSNWWIFPCGAGAAQDICYEMQAWDSESGLLVWLGGWLVGTARAGSLNLSWELWQFPAPDTETPDPRRETREQDPGSNNEAETMFTIFFLHPANILVLLRYQNRQHIYVCMYADVFVFIPFYFIFFFFYFVRVFLLLRSVHILCLPCYALCVVYTLYLDHLRSGSPESSSCAMFDCI